MIKKYSYSIIITLILSLMVMAYLFRNQADKINELGKEREQLTNEIIVSEERFKIERDSFLKFLKSYKFPESKKQAGRKIVNNYITKWKSPIDYMPTVDCSEYIRRIAELQKENFELQLKINSLKTFVLLNENSFSFIINKNEYLPDHYDGSSVDKKIPPFELPEILDYDKFNSLQKDSLDNYRKRFLEYKENYQNGQWALKQLNDFLIKDGNTYTIKPKLRKKLNRQRRKEGKEPVFN